MKFGLFYELQLPKPYDKKTWNPDDEHRIFHEMLDQVELADSVGFDYVFEVEHHHLEEYSHSSAPEMMLAALSQRTKNIRLGHGICLMPPAYNPPARVAERISALDLLSNGRVEFGTGESASVMEMGAYGVDRTKKKMMWEEATREALNMMVSEPYKGFKGDFFEFPERNVIPKPMQKPHPPVWMAASRRESTMVAARLGIGSLGFGFETPEELGERTREYYRLIREECIPIGHAINPALAVLNSLMIGDTRDEAMHRSASGPGFFSYSLGYYYNPVTGGQHHPAKENLFKRYIDSSPEAKARFEAQTAAQISQEEPKDEVQRALYRAARERNSVGTVDQVRENLLRYEKQNLDTLIFIAQAGDRKHEHIMESIEKVGKQIIPDFKERHEKHHKKWREEQLDGVEFPINSSI